MYNIYIYKYAYNTVHVLIISMGWMTIPPLSFTMF